jgi:hypothetical protein
VPHPRSAPQGSRGLPVQPRAPGYAGYALAPPPRCDRGEESSEKKIPARRTPMLDHRAVLKLIAGAILFAAFAFGLMAAPGFLSDPDSIVPNEHSQVEAVR